MSTEQLLDLAGEVIERPGGRRPRAVLGLAGAPGAGKSTLARALVAGVRERYGPDAAAYVPLDGFHLSNDQLARLGLAHRKGSPPTFDVAGYAALLARAAASGEEDVYCPDFDRRLDEPVAARHVVPRGARLVVTEGNDLATDLPGWSRARAAIDELWYLEAPDPVRRTRLVERQLESGRTPEAAREWVAGNDTPNGEVVKASRGAACVNRVVHWYGLS